MPTIDVTLPNSCYSITIETGGLPRVGSMVRALVQQRRALLAVDATIVEQHGRQVEQSLRASGFDVAVVPVTAQETQKTMQAVQRIHSVMLAQRLERTSPVVVLGGGLVGDIAGFAAATYLRGVPLIQVPTTLLAMVDASVGGKTGVNAALPDGGLGKNLIGSFWQPRAVISDPETLRSLPLRHLRCGLAESIKHGVISDPQILELIESQANQILDLEMESLVHLIERSVAVKVSIVQADERESSQRALLNLGHTFAHAIEPIPSLKLHHGEAVAIGLCAAAKCSELLDVAHNDLIQHIERVIARVGLPTRLPGPASVTQMMQLMRYDKKVQHDAIRLILPEAIGTCRIMDNVPEAVVEQAWRYVGAV